MNGAFGQPVLGVRFELVYTITGNRAECTGIDY